MRSLEAAEERLYLLPQGFATTDIFVINHAPPFKALWKKYRVDQSYWSSKMAYLTFIQKVNDF